jgi:hypothetical protein
MKLSVLLFFTLFVCGCASDRVARVADQHVEDRDELLQLLGRPGRIVKVDGGSEWLYSSRGFNLLRLEYWHYDLMCLVDEAGKVTRLELTGMSRQYHLIPPAGLPEGFEAFGATAARAEDLSLNAHRLAGGEYVLVGDLAHLYNLGRNRSDSRRRAVYQTTSAQLVFEADRREMQINGAQHWLSTPVLPGRGLLWVATVDVLKVIDPVFRQDSPRTPLLICTCPRL